MEVVGHDHEFVEQELSLTSIMEQDVYEQIGGGIGLEDGVSLGGDGGDEERSIHEEQGSVCVGETLCWWSRGNCSVLKWVSRSLWKDVVD